MFTVIGAAGFMMLCLSVCCHSIQFASLPSTHPFMLARWSCYSWQLYIYIYTLIFRDANKQNICIYRDHTYAYIYMYTYTYKEIFVCVYIYTYLRAYDCRWSLFVRVPPLEPPPDPKFAAPLHANGSFRALGL